MMFLKPRYISSPFQTCKRLFSKTSIMASDEALLEVRKKTGLITLNRPKALNALNLPMIRTIHPVLKAWNTDNGIGCVIIKGAGEKAFCAGGDVKSIAVNRGSDLGKEFFKEEYRLNLEIGQLSKPYVALINGITMGGGVGLSVHGRYRVATEKTLFAMPETAIGLFPDVGGGHFLPRLEGKLGLFLALTGNRLKARDLLFSGVATHFVDTRELPYLEDELLNLEDPSHETVKDVLDSYHNKCHDPEARFTLHDKVDTINKLFGGKDIESIFQALENDGSEWAVKQLETLKKMSPVSMKITMRQLEEGGKLSLAETLKMEYRMSQGCMENDDFYEGIRAVLIDRDHSPKWSPSTIEGVSQELEDSYFQRLSEDRELVF